jgi:hypothetical protein
MPVLDPPFVQLFFPNRFASEAMQFGYKGEVVDESPTDREFGHPSLH